MGKGERRWEEGEGKKMGKRKREREKKRGKEKPEFGENWRRKRHWCTSSTWVCGVQKKYARTMVIHDKIEFTA